MKDLYSLIIECKKDLNDIGIVVPNSNTYEYSARLTSYWGRCKTRSNKSHIILSKRLLNSSSPELAVKQTLIHEMLHSVCVGDHHGGRWKALAQRVNDAYPEIHITRTTSYEELGITPEKRESNYEIRCTKCGNVYRYDRAGKVIKNLPRYHCGAIVDGLKCGGNLEQIKGTKWVTMRAR